MAASQYDIGMIGLGVMGFNLALNMIDHGYTVACLDKDHAKVEAARQAKVNGKLFATDNLAEFLASLRQPRSIMILVPAGSPVDAVLDELLPHLQAKDIVIDGGNSYYKDTDLRSKKLSNKGIYFFGVGISGGEEGARYGPSLMPGGPKEAYDRIAPILEAVAAKVKGDPCVHYLGPRSAGHFVKMVHNGMEYGIMQLISETYDAMKRGLGLNNDQLSEVYTSWNQSELESYLLEITSQIFKRRDSKTGKGLIDEILDVARQKGTGMWTTQCAMELFIPTPTIDMAVGMRNLSMQKELRENGSKILFRTLQPYQGDQKKFIQTLSRAFYAAMIITYAQGMEILSAASEKFNYQLDLEVIASIWRGGCIVRAAFLEEIRKAYKQNKRLPHLLFDPEISKKVMERENDLRDVAKVAVDIGIPVPGFMSALNYLDGHRSAWLPANLIQAQRDYFGAHTYERIDAKGTFHTEWEKTR
jgi:6-phosphogluconate dehydrogenase